MDSSTLSKAPQLPDALARMMALPSKRKAHNPRAYLIGFPDSTSHNLVTAHGKRRRFEPKRREEVANVRKKGACMLCRVRKVTFSSVDRPCNACESYQRSHRSQNIVKWIQRVPFSLRDKEINIYETGLPFGLNSYNQLIRISNAAVDQDFSFEKKIQWDVHSLCSELALWMFDNDAQPSSTSLVGIFSSLAFERLISSSLDAVSVDLCTNLRLLVELSAALYSGSGQTPYAGLQPHELWAIQAYVGKKLFQSLDIALNTALKQASFDNMKGLFLVVLATIIAVGYSRAWNGVIHSYDFLQLPPYEYELARDQLLRVLAHHLIRIGKEVNIIKISETEKEKAENGMTEKRIIDEASCQWKRRAAFVWKEMPPHEVVGTTGHQSSRRLSEKNLQCRYHLSTSHPVTESCRPVGGFGTCVKDVNPWHFVHGPSPMDKLLVDIEQLSFEPRAQEAPSVIADFDLFPGGDFPCGGSSINGTTISTPQWGSEEGFEGFLCNCCRSACKYHEMSSQNDVCQACASPCPSEFLVDDPVFLQSVPSMISTMATNDVFFELPSWDAEGLAGVRETNGFSTTFGADDLSLSDPTLDHLGEITNGLCSVNLIV